MKSMAERRKFFKAATTELTGPHYGGLTYIPGSHHALGLNDPFDSDPNGWCTAGLYVTSHQRVAARWGPAVLEVLKDAGAPLVKTTARHKPTGVPAGVDSGSYAKYRTTGFQVIRIVGITVFAEPGRRTEDRQYAILSQLNATLRRYGKLPVELYDGEPLEELRDSRYNLWGVQDPNAVVGVAGHRAAPRRHKHRLEVEFDADHQLTEADIYSHLGTLAGLYPGSQRVVSLR